MVVPAAPMEVVAQLPQSGGFLTPIAAVAALAQHDTNLAAKFADHHLVHNITQGALQQTVMAGAAAANNSQKRRRSEGGSVGTTSPVQVKQAAQTQQRRKESHNATEQKRRQRINDKMAELKDILPANKDAAAEKQAPDKATILSDAIEFIRKLHEEVRIANEKKENLEKLNAQLKEENRLLKKAA